MKLNLTNLDQLDFSKGDGLLPVIVQHARSGKVLMQGFANKEALQKSLETGDVTFFSRSKKPLMDQRRKLRPHAEIAKHGRRLRPGQYSGFSTTNWPDLPCRYRKLLA